MNPAIIAAIIRAAGAQAAKKGAQRGAATAAGKINWAAIADGVADALPAIASGVQKVRNMRSGSQSAGIAGSSSESEAEKIQKAILDRIDAGEKISIEEIARTPIDHLPPELRELAKTIRPETIQANAAREKAGSPGPQISVNAGRPNASGGDSTGLYGMGSGIAGAISDNYYKGILESIQKTGKVPSAERKSSVGRAWDAAKGTMTPEQFVEQPKNPPQQSQTPRGWGSMPKFAGSGGMPDAGGADQRSGAPPIANEEQAKDRSLKQKLSDLVFAQTEKKRSQPDADAGGDDDEKEKAAKTFTDRLKEGATAIGNFAGPIAKAYVAAAGFVKGLELLNTGVLALNRDLAQYNGNLAQAYAKADVDQMRRDVQRGDAMETPLSALSEANSELRDTLAPPLNDLAAIGTGVLAGMTKLTTMVLKFEPVFNAGSAALEYIADFVRWWAGEQKKDEKLGPWNTFLTDVADGKHDGFRPVFNGKVGQFPEKERKEIFGA